LFSVVDDLSDSLMSVNNSAGLPVLEVFADDRVVAGQYGSGDFVLINNKVGIGTVNPTYKLHVLGDALISGNLTNPTIIGLSGALNITGSTLDTKINSLSGYSNNSFATITNLAATGSTLDTKINTTNTNLAATGSTLNAKINSLSGYEAQTFATILNLAATGSTLDTKINTLSGYANNTFLSGVGVASYVPRWSTSKQLVTGSIYDNGNVGIGVTNPSTKLNVVGTAGSNTIIKAKGVTGNNNGASFYIEKASDTSTLTAYGDTASIIGGTPDQSATIWTAGSIPLLFNIGGGEKMRISADGNVGIGITSPLQKLQVDGAVGNPASVGVTQSGIFRISNTTDNAVLDFGIRAGGLGAWIQSTDEISLAANYPLLLNPNGGNVGIGITNPGSKLDVNGSFRTAINNLTIFNDYLYVSPTENNTFNSAYSTNGIADMWINFRGYNNGNTQFRNFNVGNGKGANIAWFDGTNKRLSINNGQTASYTLDVVGNAGFTDAVNILKNGSDSISAHLYVGNAANNRAYNFQPNAAGTNLALWAYNSSNAWINTVNFNYDGNVGIGASPVGARLHIKGDGVNPILRVETAMLAGAAGGTASKTFVGWMPIQTGALSPADTVYIPLYK
jgi:hypothetical protein